MQSSQNHARDIVPLILDLDGTLIRNDITHELAVATGLRNPIDLLTVLKLGILDKPSMKRFMLERRGDRIDVANLPYQQVILDLARARKEAGGDVYLCSGSHELVVERIVSHFEWIDGGWGTSNGVNLTRENKVSFLQTRFPGGYDYVGNSAEDFEVWKAARRGYAINPPRGVASIRTLNGDAVKVLERQTRGFKSALEAMRVHQWAKNSLMMVVPVLTFADLSLIDILNVGLGFIAFSLLASATYIFNDLTDIESDRQHATKRMRMLASGRISVLRACALMAGLGLSALLIAAFLPPGFLAVTFIYLAVTLVYSFKIKRVAIADILTLSGLFSLRVFGGATLVFQPVSPWLLNFIAVFFLNLAAAKRYTELRKKPNSSEGEDVVIPGRGYLKGDEVLVLALGIAMASLSMLSFILYGLLAPSRVIDSDLAIGIISTTLCYWTMRLWLLAHRGRMNDDPVMFAIKDRISIGLGVLIALLIAVGNIL